MTSKNRHKGPASGEEGSGGGWEVVYSGFAMILLCFFIMLSSFSTLQEARMMRFVKSFIDAVSVLSGGVKPGEGGAVMNPSDPIVGSEHELASLMNDLKRLAEQEMIESDVLVSRLPRGLAMRLNDRALFDLGAAEVSAGAKKLLHHIGDIIAETDYQIRIEGHTDDLPIRTVRYPSNWELSTARAVNVLRVLQQHSGIEPRRLSAVGFGEYQPLFPNDSPAHRARNRRVEIIFIGGGALVSGEGI
jgi:chemotaxis protein MotB